MALLNISTALLFYFTNQILIYLSKKRLRNRFQLVSRLNRKFSADKRYEEPKKEKFIRKLSLPSIFFILFPLLLVARAYNKNKFRKAIWKI